jgi:hypothetical protein
VHRGYLKKSDGEKYEMYHGTPSILISGKGGKNI